MNNIRFSVCYHTVQWNLKLLLFLLRLFHFICSIDFSVRWNMMYESKGSKAVFEDEIKNKKQSQKERQCSFHWASASQSKCLAKEEASFLGKLVNFFYSFWFSECVEWNHVASVIRTPNVWCIRFCFRGIFTISRSCYLFQWLSSL